VRLSTSSTCVPAPIMNFWPPVPVPRCRRECFGRAPAARRSEWRHRCPVILITSSPSAVNRTLSARLRRAALASIRRPSGAAKSSAPVVSAGLELDSLQICSAIFIGVVAERPLGLHGFNSNENAGGRTSKRPPASTARTLKASSALRSESTNRSALSSGTKPIGQAPGAGSVCVRR
jgi:hypothetical protein